MKQNMFFGALPVIFENAKQLRKNMTGAEKILWDYLKMGINGFKFRRQHPMGFYIADFYCHKARLVIEVDGSIHQNVSVKKYDEARQQLMEKDGLNVIRFSNTEIFNEITEVLKKITSCLEQK